MNIANYPESWTFLSVLVVVAILSASHALLHKRDPRSAVVWILFCFLLPALGPLLYWLLGVNRIRMRAVHWEISGRWSIASTEAAAAATGLHVESLPVWAQHLNPLAFLTKKVSGLPLLDGNQITALHNGEAAYPAMLAAIATAKDYIYLSTYIFDADKTGQQFVAALAQKAEAGVDVRVLVDGLGQYYSFPTVLRRLRKTRVRSLGFLPITPSNRGIHFNLRNHRKILVVDGLRGFTGGMNISDRHCLAQDGRRKVTDIHFDIRGPVVSDLEAAFLADWFFMSGENPPHDQISCAQPCGRALSRGIAAGPNLDYERLICIVIGALTCARDHVRIMTPYFIPDRALLSALNTAALRGVKVEVILPEKNNLFYMKWASRAYLWELAQNGVKIYYQPPPFAHSKLFIVDDTYSLVGSMNLDPRSLRLNFEFNIEVYDSILANSLVQHFDQVRDASQALSLQELDKRPVRQKLMDATAKLFSPYL